MNRVTRQCISQGQKDHALLELRENHKKTMHESLFKKTMHVPLFKKRMHEPGHKKTMHVPGHKKTMR